ncbi:MAG: DUF2778 domain-containing protein [Bradyrhizobiaceae bacterium]|nr:DUF2778 domain-containing protein [Bradyrhizobiaceae bacterium]
MVAGSRAIWPTDPPAEPATESEAATGADCATFDERFYFDQQPDSFDERFASAFGPPENDPGKPATAGMPDSNAVPDNDTLPPQPDTPALTQPLLPDMTSRHAAIGEGRPDPAEEPVRAGLPPDSDGHTAIYDIAARTVYLPNGHRLEAHSGLGRHLDDPRSIRAKGQGATPPNVYNLALRERLFHGVRALRLVPVESGKMFGRDGILAHSYMLGPSGQSNGCVSFRNYPAFLHAFLKGEVNRLVVVEHLATTTDAKAASGTRSASGG